MIQNSEMEDLALFIKEHSGQFMAGVAGMTLRLFRESHFAEENEVKRTRRWMITMAGVSLSAIIGVMMFIDNFPRLSEWRGFMMFGIGASGKEFTELFIERFPKFIKKRFFGGK